MKKNIFLFLIGLILFSLPYADATLATYPHVAIKVADGKDIDLAGTTLRNGSIAGITGINETNWDQNYSNAYAKNVPNGVLGIDSSGYISPTLDSPDYSTGVAFHNGTTTGQVRFSDSVGSIFFVWNNLLSYVKLKDSDGTAYRVYTDNYHPGTGGGSGSINLGNESQVSGTLADTHLTANALSKYNASYLTQVNLANETQISNVLATSHLPRNQANGLVGLESDFAYSMGYPNLPHLPGTTYEHDKTPCTILGLPNGCFLLSEDVSGWPRLLLQDGKGYIFDYNSVNGRRIWTDTYHPIYSNAASSETTVPYQGVPQNLTNPVFCKYFAGSSQNDFCISSVAHAYGASSGTVAGFFEGISEVSGSTAWGLNAVAYANSSNSTAINEIDYGSLAYGGNAYGLVIVTAGNNKSNVALQFQSNTNESAPDDIIVINGYGIGSGKTNPVNVSAGAMAAGHGNIIKTIGDVIAYNGIDFSNVVAKNSMFLGQFEPSATTAPYHFLQGINGTDYRYFDFLSNNRVQMWNGSLDGNTTIVQNSWIPCAFDAPWGNVGSGRSTCGYMKDSMGFVHIRGSVIGGLSDSSVFTLPPGYRRLGSTYSDFPCAGLATATPISCSIDVVSAGNVYVLFSGTPTTIGLNLIFDTREGD